MQQQSLLDATSTPLLYQYYLCFRPGTEAGLLLHILANEMRKRYGIKLRDPASLHISTHYLGEFEETPPKLLQALQKIADSLAIPAFEITLDRAESVGNSPHHRPFILRMGEKNRELFAFHETVRKELILAGFGRELTTGFSPHLTLFYGKSSIESYAITPIRWIAREFVLVRSQRFTGQQDIKSWRLR